MDNPNPHVIPPTISQDATCDYCDTKHATTFNKTSGPLPFHYRYTIWCPSLGRFVAKMNLLAGALQVLPDYVGHVHLSAPLVVHRRRDRRNGVFDWLGRQAQAPIPAAPPPPPRPLPNKKVIKISLAMINQNTTHEVQHEITLNDFRLKSLPDHIQQHLHVAEIVPKTLQICMANDWKNVPAQGTDVSEVRNHNVLRLRAVSSRFPLTYAQDMASGLRKFCVKTREDPEASLQAVFEACFPGTPWANNSDAFFDAHQLWTSLPRHLQDKYSTADRNDANTWVRVVGAADMVRDLAAEPPIAGGSQKRKRRASSEPEIIDNPPPRRTTVKKEPEAPPPPKKLRRQSQGKVVEIFDDDEIEIIDLTD